MIDSPLPIRPTFLAVDLDALGHNVGLLREMAGGASLLAVVKANAYGCGAVPVARAALAAGASWLGVALVAEGLQLRNAGICAPVLLLGPAAPEECAALLDASLTPAVYGLSFLRALDAAASRSGAAVRAHLKVDSGMGRLGVRPEELPPLLAEWEKCPHVILDGVFSNLARAEDPPSQQNAWQVERFLSILETVRSAGYSPELVHLANSSALLSRSDAAFTLVRPGLSLFGMRASDSLPDPGLRPVLSFHTTIVQRKVLPQGTPVGYGGTFVTAQETAVGVLQIGYADGLPRNLSGPGSVLVAGRRCPLVGRVSMDLAAVDLSSAPDAREGDIVTLWGRDGDEEITPWDWARWSGTIPYEITCGIGPRVARIYLSGGRPTMDWPLEAPPLGTRK